MPSIVRQCSCESEYQDKMYGKRMRVWNHAPMKRSRPKRYRCTICGREQEFNQHGITE